MVEELNIDINTQALRDLFEEAWTHLAWSPSYPTVQSGISVDCQDLNNYLNACGGGFTAEQEKSFNTLHSFYKNTYMEELLLKFDFSVFRLRWMILFGKGCYSFHRDWTTRVHIPIITNAQAYLIFKEPTKAYHLSVGKTYLVDTTQTHSGMNGHNEWRVHLVGCVTNNK